MIRLGKKKYPNRFWCQCKKCKGQCGYMVDKRSLRHGRKWFWICSYCRRGDHVKG